MNPPRLIPAWRSAWRYWSVQLGVAAVAFGSMPEAWQAQILGAVGVPPGRVLAVAGALALVARLLAQQPPPGAPPPAGDAGAGQ